jgi:uncharacterized coiled-coil protein SlyX
VVDLSTEMVEKDL